MKNQRILLLALFVNVGHVVSFGVLYVNLVGGEGGSLVQVIHEIEFPLQNKIKEPFLPHLNQYIADKKEYFCTDCKTEKSNTWNRLVNPKNPNESRTVCFNCSTKYKQLYLHSLDEKTGEVSKGAIMFTSNVLKTKEDKEQAIHICANREKVDNDYVWIAKLRTKPKRLVITEEAFMKALRKVEGEIRITPLYNAYDKSGYPKHVPSVVKTKIRAFGKTLVAKGKIQMVRAKGQRYFVYTEVKKMENRQS